MEGHPKTDAMGDAEFHPHTCPQGGSLRHPCIGHFLSTIALTFHLHFPRSPLFLGHISTSSFEPARCIFYFGGYKAHQVYIMVSGFLHTADNWHSHGCRVRGWIFGGFYQASATFVHYM